MRLTDRVILIVNSLEKLYPNPPIPLVHKDNFSLLIAVVLSAQSTDKKVNELTPALLKKAPTPKLMNQMGEHNIYEFIKELGLSKQKARYLHQLSGILVDKYESKVPDNFNDLESLPGVGHKTASVVMSQGFGHPAFPVDTHIHRLAQRWGLTNGKNVIQTEIDLKRLFPKKFWNKLHLQIIYYGREYCKARECYGLTCKICTTCYPNRKSPVKTKKA